MVKGITFPVGNPGAMVEFDKSFPVSVTGLTPGSEYRVFVEVGSVTPLPSLGLASLSASRVGGVLSLNNPDPNKAYYVTSRRPNSNTPWMVQTMHDWSETGFTLDKRLLGLEFIVRCPIVDPTTKLVTGYDESQVFGPILPATDLPAHNGTTVRWCGTAAELNAAIDSTACTLAVMKPGTTWALNEITFTNKNRLASRLTITTPQNNPARFLDSSTSMLNTKGITFEGLVFRGTAAWAMANFNAFINSTDGMEGCYFNACKWVGDEVPENVRQDVSGYTQTNPTGSAYSPLGFNFLTKTVNILRSTDVKFTDCTMENVWTAGDFSPNIEIERLRVRGVYWDNIRLSMQSAGQVVSGGRIADMIVTDCLTLADEMYNEANRQEPHFDVIQIFGTGQYIEDLTIENVVFCAGDTRASKTTAELGGYNQGEYPLMRTSTNHRGTVYRNGLATARGPSGFEFNQITDGWADRICSLDFPQSGGGTSITVLGGSQGNPSKNEMRVTNCYVGTEIRNAATVSDTYLTTENNIVGLNSATAIEGSLSKAAKPKGPIELAQYARPKVDDGIGPVDAKGYMRPLSPIPSRTPATIASLSPGGFRVTATAVSGATGYIFRYRLAGSNAWTVVNQVSNVLSVTNFAPSVSVESDWTYRVGDNFSRWNKEADRKTVTTATSPPVTPPTLTLVPEIGGNAIATTPTTATSSGARNMSFYAADAAPVSDEHVALFAFDQMAGGGRVIGDPAAMWITQSSVAFDPMAALAEIGSSYNLAPSSSRKYIGSFNGKPPANARGVRLNMTPNTSHQAAVGAALFRLSRASTQRQNSATAQLTTAGTCTVTMTVPPGTAFAVLAMSNNGAPVLSSPIETLGTNQSSGNATYQWVAGRLYSSAGGTITLTATNCRMLEVSAITG